MTLLREKYTNGVETTLAETLDASETGIDVTDSTSWPDAGFRVRVDGEIMYVTANVANTLTVVRGAEGTTAATHASGAAINHVITAEALDRIRLGILSDVGIAPYIESLSADDDEFDDDTFSGWTAIAGSPTIGNTLEKNHRFSAIIPTGTASAQYYAWVKAKTPSAGDYIQAGFQLGGSGGQFPIPALFMANGNIYNAGKQVVFGWSPHEAALIIREMTGYNANVGASNYGTMGNYPAVMHLRMKWLSNDHYSLYTSADGLNWADVAINGSFGSIGAVPTHCGFGFSSWGASREFEQSITYFRFSF